MITAVCVLKTGGIYNRQWLHALKRGLALHLPSPNRFVCLSDDLSVEPYWRIPLDYRWPRWWSKMELFRPGLFEGQILYMDLDTLPVGSLSPICNTHVDFAMLSDFYRPINAQSGVLMFVPGEMTARIWERWSANPDANMRQFRGDGEFLNHVTGGKVARLQNLFPGQIVSYKVHAKRGVPANARLVCGHGNPRFSDQAAGWAHQVWKTQTVGT